MMRPSLDLVNTSLRSPADLQRWLRATRLLSGGGEVPAEVLEEALGLREAIDAGVIAAVAGERPDPAAIRVIDDWLVHAGSRPQLALDGDGRARLGERAPADSPRRALGMVALDAATMLGRPEEAARVRVCASETCSTRFYDRSPGGRRRWCSMRTCGNEAKARRHRARGRAAA